MTKHDTLRTGVLAAAFAAALALTGCAAGGGGGGATTGAPTSTATGHDDRTQAETVTATDFVAAEDDGHTSVFGTLTNDGHHDAVLASGSTPVAAGVDVSGHDGPITVPASGTLVLQDGGDHLHLEDVATPLASGEEFELTLEFEDGSTLTIPVVTE